MVTNNESESCVKCQKVVKSTENVLVCGLWCRKSFHNDCVGLSYSETNVVTCSKERIKFHCETCENRLGLELSGGKELHERNKLENCVNNFLLELVQKLLKLTNELSNDNSVINTKLDTVISSNARLEEYILQSPKSFEKRSEDSTDNSVEYVECFSAPRTMVIKEEYNDTNSDNAALNREQFYCASKPQQSDINSSSLHNTTDVPNQLPVSDSQQPNVAEECSSDCLQEWEVPVLQSNMQDPQSIKEEGLQVWEVSGHQNNTKDPPGSKVEECSPSKDYIVHRVFSIEKRECQEQAEREMREINNEVMAEEKNYVTLEDVQSTRQEEEEPSNLNNDNNNGANDVADTSAIPLNPYAYLFTSERFKKEVRGLPKYYGIGDFSPSQDVIEVLSIEKTEYESDEEQAETGSNNEPPGPGGAPPEQYPVGRGPPGGRGSPQHFGWGGGHQPWQNRQHPTDQVQVNPATGQPDYSIQWAEYYRSLGMHREAEMIEQQAEASKGLAGPGQPQQGAGPQPQQQPAGPGPQAVTTQNGQPDYSAQWAEYYRSIGKIKEAEALEVQMKAGKVGQAGPGGPQPGAPESQ